MAKRETELQFVGKIGKSWRTWRTSSTFAIGISPTKFLVSWCLFSSELKKSFVKIHTWGSWKFSCFCFAQVFMFLFVILRNLKSLISPSASEVFFVKNVVVKGGRARRQIESSYHHFQVLSRICRLKFALKCFFCYLANLIFLKKDSRKLAWVIREIRREGRGSFGAAVISCFVLLKICSLLIQD